jgi:hypothetical protein
MLKTLAFGQQVFEKDGDTYVKGVCTHTGKDTTVGPLSREHLVEWLHGTPIQIAIPELNTGDREFLISGLSSEGFDQLFPIEEEEEESKDDLGLI